MDKIRQAFEAWTLTLDLERLAAPDFELLHLLNNAVQLENLRKYKERKGA